MITPETLLPEPPEDPNHWWGHWGLPGGTTVDCRNLIRQRLRSALSSYPQVSLDVDAGARVIMVTVWPSSSLNGDIMKLIQNVLEPHVSPDFQIRLFVSETPPWWI
jgi:hypothetical protein